MSSSEELSEDDSSQRYRDNTLRGDPSQLKLTRKFSMKTASTTPSINHNVLFRTASTKEYRNGLKETSPQRIDPLFKKKRHTLDFADLPKSDIFYTFPAHNSPIMCFFIDKEIIYTGGWDRQIKSWNTELSKCTHNFSGHEGWISALLLHEEILYSGSSDTTIRAWDSKTAKLLKVFEGHTEHILQLEVNCIGNDKNSMALFSGSSDSTLRIWDIETGTCLKVLKSPDFIHKFIFYNNCVITTGSLSIHVWENLESSNPVLSHKLKEHDDNIWSLAIHQNFLYSSSWDKTIKKWSLEDYKLQANFQGHEGHVYCIYIEGNTLYSGSADATARSWTLDGVAKNVFKGHEGSIEDLIVKVNRLFTASADCTIRVWNAQNAQNLSIYKGHTSFILQLQFSSGVLYSRSNDGHVGSWL